MLSRNIIKALSVLCLAVFIGMVTIAVAAEEDVLTIGCVFDLSGETAYFDMPAYNGVKMAVEEINAAGGIGGKYKIKLAAKDYRMEGPLAVAMTKALLDEGASVFIGPTMTSYTIAVGKLTQEKEVPMLSPISSAPYIPNAIGPYGFNGTVSDNLQGAVLAKYAIELGYKTAYLFTSPDDPYTEFLPKYFAKAFEKMGGKILGTTSFSFSQQEFSVEARKVKKLNPQPDLIVSSAFAEYYAGLIKGLRMAGVKAHYFGADAIDEPSALGLGPVTEGVVFTTASYPSSGSSMEAFNKKYKQTYGEENQAMFPALGYDMVKVIEAAVLKAKSINGRAIRDAIMTLKDVQGATSKISYVGTDRNPLRKVAICKMQGGKKVLVKWMTLAPEEVPEPL